MEEINYKFKKGQFVEVITQKGAFIAVITSCNYNKYTGNYYGINIDYDKNAVEQRKDAFVFEFMIKV